MSASSKKIEAEQSAIEAVKPPITPDEAFDLIGKIYASSMKLADADKARLKAHAAARAADKFFETVL